MSSGKSSSSNDNTAQDQAAQDQPQASTSQPTPANVAYVPMPRLGLQALAEQLYPDDRDDRDKMAAHVRDLWLLNNDTLRDESSHQVGQMVRIPQ